MNSIHHGIGVMAGIVGKGSSSANFKKIRSIFSLPVLTIIQYQFLCFSIVAGTKLVII